MATRSAIGVMRDGRITAIYCHWDGYIENNGRILQKHYDMAKAQRLVDMGDLSVLRPEIGEQHAFKDPNPDWCVFYARDRGEDPPDRSVFYSTQQFINGMDGSGCEYFYLMDGGVWYVSRYGRDFERLETLIEELENEDA